MNEAARFAVEAAGALLIVVALLLVSVPLGLLTLGVMLVLAANFYMRGEDDAGTGEHDQANPPQRE